MTRLVRLLTVSLIALLMFSSTSVAHPDTSKLKVHNGDEIHYIIRNYHSNVAYILANLVPDAVLVAKTGDLLTLEITEVNTTTTLANLSVILHQADGSKLYQTINALEMFSNIVVPDWSYWTQTYHDNNGTFGSLKKMLKGSNVNFTESYNQTDTSFTASVNASIFLPYYGNFVQYGQVSYNASTGESLSVYTSLGRVLDNGTVQNLYLAQIERYTTSAGGHVSTSLTTLDFPVMWLTSIAMISMIVVVKHGRNSTEL